MRCFNIYKLHIKHKSHFLKCFLNEKMHLYNLPTESKIFINNKHIVVIVYYDSRHFVNRFNHELRCSCFIVLTIYSLPVNFVKRSIRALTACNGVLVE